MEQSDSSTGGQQRIIGVTLAGIFVTALGLRLYGSRFGLPYLYDADEPLKVWLATNMVRAGTLDPQGYFLKPTFFMYLNAAAYEGYYLLGRLLGWFAAPSDLALPTAVQGALGVGRAATPALFVIGRSLTALFGAGTTLLVYASGRRATGRPLVGLIAALLLAVLPIEVANSQLVAPDVYMVFFLCLTFYGALGIFQTGARRHYLIAAIGTGLTAANKYNGGAILIAPVAAHFLYHGFNLKALLDRRLLLMANFSIVVFLLAVPYALIDWLNFIANVYFEFFHYSTGHPGGDSNVLVFYSANLARNLGLILPVALAGAVLWWRRDRRLAGLVLVFPLLYFLFINLFAVHSERMLLLLDPFLVLLAAYSLADVPALVQHPRLAALNAWFKRRAPNWGAAVGLSLALLLLIAWPLLASLAAGRSRANDDSRETARVWIAANLPAGSTMALESYAPYVDPAVYKVIGVPSAGDRSPDWYRQEAVDYLVLSQGMFARFYEQPAIFAAEVQAYDALKAAFPTVRHFDDGGYEVIVLQVTDP